MPRLFAALEIPHEALLPLSLLRGGLPHARWMEPADYHITLRFYGDISNGQADALAGALDGLHFAPFELRLKGVGVFSPKKPRTIYAGVEASKPLAALQAKIEHISRRAVPPETRKFMPHITLARLKKTDSAVQPSRQSEALAVNEAELARYLAGRGNFSSPIFAVKRFCLMSSKDSVGGGPYIIEESWPLTAAAAAGVK